MTYEWPNLAQQRAFAYAAKPFAATSFLASAFAMYYLLILNREKLKRMYHRIMLSAFFCCASLSFALFWGTWAMPATDWAVGESGTTVTCSIQGFLITTFWLAFPFNYASLGVISCVALKNDFKEEKYAWMEKWIHIGTYLPQLSYAIVAAVNGWFRQSYAFCTVVKVADECVDDYRDPSCHSIELYLMRSAIVFTELLIATIAMIILLCSFNRSMIERVGSSGRMNIVAKARTQRFNEVVRQSGLYMISCWLCYVPLCIQSLVWITSGMIYYNVAIVSLCLFACQGIVITVIYFALQRKSKQEIKDIIPGRRPLANANHETVSMIRANAARPPSRSSLRGASTSRKEFSFNIFDGCPDEDSPWAAYLYDDEMDETNVSMLEAEEEAGMRNDLSTSLLEDHLHI